jgi:hypothetical protein
MVSHVVEEMGQRVPDGQQIKFRGAAGGKIERQQSSDQQTVSRFCRERTCW